MPFMLMGVNKRLDRLIELQGGEPVKTSKSEHSAKDFYIVAAIIIGLIIAAQIFAG
jgi:hypothetical protein